MIGRITVLPLLLLLAACGFQPMYAGGEGTDTAQARVASVRIQPVSDRVGQLVHNALVAQLNPYGQPSDPAFLLDIQIEEDIRRTSFRKDETATRANLEIDARYELRDAETNRLVARGRARSINSANILDQPYASVVAARDARERGANHIANQIAHDVMSRLAAE